MKQVEGDTTITPEMRVSALVEKFVDQVHEIVCEPDGDRARNVILDAFENLLKRPTTVSPDVNELRRLTEVEIHSIREHMLKAEKRLVCAIEARERGDDATARVLLEAACDSEYEALADCRATGAVSSRWGFDEG